MLGLRVGAVVTMALLLMAAVPMLARGYRTRLEDLISISFFALLVPWSVGLAMARPRAAAGTPARGPALLEGLALGGIVASVGLPLGLGLLARRPPEPAMLGFLALLGLAQAAALAGAVHVRRGTAATRSRGLFIAGAVFAAVPFTFLAIGQLVGFGRSSNTESRAIGELRTMVSAQVAYSFMSGGLYGAPECLVRPQSCLTGYPPDGPTFLDPKSLEPVRNGYRFVFQGGTRKVGSHPASGYEQFAATAVPLEPGRTGIRVFCADSTGAIRFAMEGPLPPLSPDGLCPPSMATLP